MCVNELVHFIQLKINIVLSTLSSASFALKKIAFAYVTRSRCLTPLKPAVHLICGITTNNVHEWATRAGCKLTPNIKIAHASM
jgi:hypothetical protein